ncbi:MAG: 6-carboxytetrahydropterin synthase [Fimbriimonadaceae bacterium]|nr:6-carboxytetrahydropterin synthase [Fimbriimonadaceae bacterium]
MRRAVALTRVVRFSSGHRYWEDAWPEVKNREVFGEWASPHYHGHNYVMEVTAEGPTDPSTGMVVNIKDIDTVLQERVVALFHQRSINEEVPGIKAPPTLETLLAYFQERLARLPGQSRLVRLRLEESPELWGTWTEEMVTITRSYEFATSHRLYVPSLSEAENESLFGKCCRASGHGHNYVVEVSVSGEVDALSGMSVDLGELDAVVEREILDRYDHRNLNTDVDDLAGLNPTSEVVALAIFDRLKPVVPGRLVKVVLWETSRNGFEVSA